MAKTVLIVEDSELNMKLFNDLLEAFGYRTVKTRDGRQALPLAREHKPDLIIMDIYLKGTKNGLELAQEIHSMDPIPVLFLTASTKPEIVEAIRALKGCHYLPKPINSDSLEDVLQRFARGEK